MSRRGSNFEYDPYDSLYGSSKSTRQPSKLDGPLGLLLIFLAYAAIVAALFIVPFLIIWIFPAIGGNGAIFAHDTLGMLKGMFFPGGWPTPFFWIMASIVAGAALITWAGRRGAQWVLSIILTIVMVLGASAFAAGKSFTQNILASDYYLTTTTLQVEDRDALPSMLQKYVDNQALEVPLNEGDLSTSWVPRAASATGAYKVLSKTSGAVNNAELMADTISYIYGEGTSGMWTGIRNGINQQDIYGISSWNGTGNEDRINTCRFEGDFDLKKNFGGNWGKNLWDSVASAYPSFYYTQSDMWGYCDGEEPIIVVPGVYLSHTDVQVADTPAGVVTIRGSKSGEPVIDFLTDLEPGDLPGPVYPQRVVNHQRDALDWASGYWQSVNEAFGFDTTSVESQSGNNSNFLLKSAEDGRLYWVTPMKPQATDDQTLIAYSMILADEVSSNKLNPQVVYVLNEEDPRVANLDDLASYAQDAACGIDTNFCGKSPKGSIVEFLPVSDTNWQAFGEIEGRVKYLVDLEVNGTSIKTRTTTLISDNGEAVDPNSAPSSEDATCDTPSSLTDKQLADCLTALATELQTRNGSEE